MPTKKRIGIAIAIAALGLLYRFGGLLFVVFFTMWQIHSTPELWIVPKPLADSSVDHSPGKKISFLGYECESPWINFDKETKVNSSVTLTFSEGEIFAYPEDDVADLKRQTAANTIIDAIGDAAISSNYAFRSKVLYLTPQDMHFFPSPRRKVVANALFLNLKRLYAPASVVRTGMYSFQTEAIRGFQIGSPTQSRLVEIYAFSKQDRAVTVGLRLPPDAKGELTQAKVNRIIYSLRPVSPDEAKTAFGPE